MLHRPIKKHNKYEDNFTDIRHFGSGNDMFVQHI